MYTTSPSLRRARSAGPTGVPSSTSSIRTSSSRITVTGAVSPVRLGGWPATGTTRLRSPCPFRRPRSAPPPAPPGPVPTSPSPPPAPPPPPPSRTVSSHALTAVVVGDPQGVGPKLAPPVGVDPRRRPPRRETEAVHPDGQPAGVRVGDLDVRGHDQRRAGEPHRADADVVAERRELLLEGRDRRVGVPAADDPQAGRFLAQTHARVLRAAEAEPDDRRLAREAALAELHQRVDEEPLDAGDPVRREEHAVVGAEEPALVDRGGVDPVRPPPELLRDLGRVDADVVVVIPPCDRVDSIGPEGDRGGRVRRGSAESPPEGAP